MINVITGNSEVGRTMVRHPGIDCVSFTGSTAAGKVIGAACGAQIKRVGLELGGKSAAVLLDDVDVTTAVPAVLNGGMFSINGQACVAWSRILVPRRRHDEIVEALCETARKARIGDPLDPATLLGPLAAARQRDRVEGYIALGVSEGARIAVGGGRPTNQPTGWFVEPTVLVDADNSMRVCREEIFGPVVAVIPHDGDDHAVEIANDSSYGLSAGVFSADDERALRVARSIRSGSVGVKSSGLNVAFPNGGFKESGFGRQYGPEGVGVRKLMREAVPAALTCGTEEENVHNNRVMAAALADQGYIAKLDEVPDLHNYTGWRDAFDPYLTRLLEDW